MNASIHTFIHLETYIHLETHFQQLIIRITGAIESLQTKELMEYIDKIPNELYDFVIPGIISQINPLFGIIKDLVGRASIIKS